MMHLILNENLKFDLLIYFYALKTSQAEVLANTALWSANLKLILMLQSSPSLISISIFISIESSKRDEFKTKNLTQSAMTRINSWDQKILKIFCLQTIQSNSERFIGWNFFRQNFSTFQIVQVTTRGLENMIFWSTLGKNDDSCRKKILAKRYL